MTQMQHFLIAQIILFTLWHFFFRHYVLTAEDYEKAEKLLDKWLKK